MDATPDPTFPLLALPGDALDHIAYLLPPADRCGGKAQRPLLQS